MPAGRRPVARPWREELGISLGKVNCCLKALLDKGYIKARNFARRQSKQRYLYKLTSEGLTAKAKATKRFLASKQAEYERFRLEIEDLRREAAGGKG